MAGVMPVLGPLVMCGSRWVAPVPAIVFSVPPYLGCAAAGAAVGAAAAGELMEAGGGATAVGAGDPGDVAQPARAAPVAAPAPSFTKRRRVIPRFGLPSQLSTRTGCAF